MIDKLEFLIALARHKHFRRAAEACGVTQPTLSAGIRALEESLGAALVNRGSRYVGLTGEGERALAWARRIIAEHQGMREELEALKRGVAGVVRIACIPTALPIAARLSAALARRHPQVSSSILSASFNAIVAMLQDFQIDGAVTYLDTEPLPGLKTIPLYQESYRLVTASPDLFAGRETVSWSELGDVPLCLFTRDMQNRRIVDQMLGPRRQAPFAETNSSLVMATQVSSGQWSSIMPPVLIEAVSLSPTARAIRIEGPEVTHSVGLAVAARDPATPLVRALVAAAREIAEPGDNSPV